MSDQHPRCPRCSGLLKFEPKDIHGPARVNCILCSWEKFKPEEQKSDDSSQKTDLKNDSCLLNSEYLPKEKPMRRPTHGHCPSCGRDDVNMPGPICSRCYSRKARGIAIDAPNRYPEKPRRVTTPALDAVGPGPEPAPVAESRRSGSAIDNNVELFIEGGPGIPVPPLRSHDLKASCVRPPAFHRPSQILTTYTLFAHESNLVKELLVRAKKSRRTLEGEILFRLEQTLEVF